MKKKLSFVLAALLILTYIPFSVNAGGCDHPNMIAPTCTTAGVCRDCGIRYAPLEHSYDDDYDVDCNWCGEKREADANGKPVIPDVPGDSEDTTLPEVPVVPDEPDHPEYPDICDHEYDSPCDGFCNICNEWRDTGVDYHSYDNPCDAFCNECGYERIPRDHVYDNYCSTVCILCGFVREDPGHSYYADCADECYWCGHIRTPLTDHSYSSDCDPECNNCSYWRGDREHQYDNGCDKDCNVCGKERWVGEHLYDNRCDTDCNECGFERLPEGEHEYDRNCDKECNICGYIRSGYDHVYSDTYDDNCNICGETRYVPIHSVIYEQPRDVTREYDGYVTLYVGYNGAYTCTWYKALSDGSFKSIGTENSVSIELNEANNNIRVYCELTNKQGSTVRTRTATLHLHTYDNGCDDSCNSCSYMRYKQDHYYDSACDADCNECGFVRVPDHEFWSPCEHQCRGCGTVREAPHVYYVDCDEECNYCGHRRTPPKDHTYEYPCSEYCNVCGTWRETEGLHTFDNVCDRNCNLCDFGRDVEGHRYDNDCDAYCNNCGEYRRPRYHWYDNDCDPDCNTCGALRDASHQYDDENDEYCNSCGAWRETEKEEPEAPDVPVVPDVPADGCRHQNKVEPTCTSEGYCRDCGSTFSSFGHSYDDDSDPTCNWCGEEREVIDGPTECNHEYVSNILRTPTCNDDGIIEFSCQLCGEKYSEMLPATGEHIYDDENDEYCNQCGAWRETEKEEPEVPDVPVVPDVPADGCRHQNKVEPTCTRDGYCRDCGTTFSSFGHSYDDDSDPTCNWCGEEREVIDGPTECNHEYVSNVLRAPTCNDDGIIEFSCQLCGEKYSEMLPATGEHIYDDEYDEYCNQCGAWRETEKEEPEVPDVPADGCRHQYSECVVFEATCDSNGVMEYMCDYCGDYYTEPIPSIGHSYTYTVTSPDCTNGGYTTYVCTACGDSYVDGETASLGHKYDNACDTDCNRCGATRTITHNFAAATCTKAKTCKVCGATSGTKLGHKYDNACDKTCNRCDATRTITHSYAAATCTKAKTCKVCGAVSGSKLGHKYDNACDKTCNRCNTTRVVTHNYKTTTTKATLSKNGTVVKKCTVCGYVQSKTTVKYAKTFILSADAFVYNGKAMAPTVTVKDSAGKVLKQGTDYTVSLASGRINVGTYKVTVTMKGNYTGTKTLTFKINPVAVSLKSLKASTRSFTATWTPKTTQVTGYEIQYSLKKDFSNTKTATVSNASTKTKTVSGLSRGKTYYVRIRTYKTVNGTKYYSAWSASMYAPVK